jgi:hypothetical protein
MYIYAYTYIYKPAGGTLGFRAALDPKVSSLSLSLSSSDISSIFSDVSFCAVCVCVCVRTYNLHVYTYIHTHTHTHTHSLSLSHTHTHTHTQTLCDRPLQKERP